MPSRHIKEAQRLANIFVFSRQHIPLRGGGLLARILGDTEGCQRQAELKRERVFPKVPPSAFSPASLPPQAGRGGGQGRGLDRSVVGKDAVWPLGGAVAPAGPS